MLSVPVHILPGDHDMQGGGFDAFYQVLGADPLPKAVTVRGARCLFLDDSGSGGGGPDFRVGSDQAAWVEQGAGERGEQSLVSMHSYPDDLEGEGETEAFNRLVVALVDLGHTHSTNSPTTAARSSPRRGRPGRSRKDRWATRSPHSTAMW